MRNQGHVTAIGYVRDMYAKHSIPTGMDSAQGDADGRKGNADDRTEDSAYVDCDGMVTVVMRDKDGKSGKVTENRYMFPAGWFAGNDDGNSKPWYEEITQCQGIIIDEHRKQLSSDTLPV